MSGTCLLCSESVLDGEPLASGTWFDIDGASRQVHVECALRSVVGGWGHISDHERWCLGEGDPDGGLTFRASALLVADWVDRFGIPGT